MAAAELMRVMSLSSNLCVSQPNDSHVWDGIATDCCNLRTVENQYHYYSTVNFDDDAVGIDDNDVLIDSFYVIVAYYPVGSEDRFLYLF